MARNVLAFSTWLLAVDPPPSEMAPPGNSTCKPLAPGLLSQPSPEGLREWGFPAGTIPRVANSVGTAPSAPRSRPLAATLFGGLRPGSLRVHDPCKEYGHGSRLGFPGRRLPRGPAALGNVARDLQVLPKNKIREENWVFPGGRGEMGLGPSGTWFAPVPKTFGKRSAGGGGRPVACPKGVCAEHPT